MIVVDDQNVDRSYFEMYVNTSLNYELVGSLSAAEFAVPYCDSHPVDLILMDVMMRYGIDGLTAAEKIKKKHPGIKIILTTSMAEASWEKRAREIGVESFWYKEYSEEPLLDVMDRTVEGESVYPDNPPKVQFGNVFRSEMTERELDVLRELTSGATNEEIADKLCISVNTVKRHIQNLLDKTGYTSRLALAVNAKSLGLVVSDRDRNKENLSKST